MFDGISFLASGSDDVISCVCDPGDARRLLRRVAGPGVAFFRMPRGPIKHDVRGVA